MDRRLRQILGQFNSKESVNTDTFINVQFNGDQNLLPTNDINKVVNLTEQFNLERQSCKFYRILGTIRPLVSNVLFNTTGTKDCMEIFNTPLFTANDLDKDQPFLTFGDSIKKNLKEVEGWYGYFDPVLTSATLCNFYDMEPKRERFSFIPDTTNIPSSQVKNWELTITYPYAKDDQHVMVNNGLLIVDTAVVFVGGKRMTAFGVAAFHNLLNGGTVRISGTTVNGEYDVKRVGLDDGTLKENYFCIDVNPDTVTIGNNSRMSKVYNGYNSKYYFRKFKKIKTRSTPVIEQDDYEIYKLAFSETIFADEVNQFVFNEDIDVSDLVDNLGRPLSELYLTIVKTTSNGIFTNVVSGIEAPHIAELTNGNSNPFINQVPVIQRMHGASGTGIPPTTIPLESSVTINNADFYGDLVEYNITTLEEVVLADIQHRFNTINRETTGNSTVSGPRPEGYYYKAHNLIKIRDFSSYVEEGTANTDNKPDYSVIIGDRYLWRDLFDIGRIDINQNTVNYPFINGCHYMYNNYPFQVRRQDPFDDWDLYHSGFPSDPIGNTMNKSFNINSADDVC